MIYKRPESVMVFAGKRLLLLQRQQPLGFWQPVTGSLAWGESAEAAAWRELAEETGLKPSFLAATPCAWVYPIHPAWRGVMLLKFQKIKNIFLLLACQRRFLCVAFPNIAARVGCCGLWPRLG